MEFWEMFTHFFSMKDKYGGAIRPVMKAKVVDETGRINIEVAKNWDNVDDKSLAEQKQREEISEKMVRFWDDFVKAESSKDLNKGLIKKVSQLLKGDIEYIDSDKIGDAEKINIVFSEFMQFLGKEKSAEFTMAELSQIGKLLKKLKSIENPK